jgi:hypothetical protein
LRRKTSKEKIENVFAYLRNMGIVLVMKMALHTKTKKQQTLKKGLWN